MNSLLFTQLGELKIQQLKDQGSFVLSEFQGDLSDSIVQNFIAKIEQTCIENGIPKPLIKKLFSVLIEGMQNMLRHSYFTNDIPSVGSCLVIGKMDRAEVYFTNYVSVSQVLMLKALMEELNLLDYNALKQKYLYILTNGDFSEKGGAGLGLYTMRLKSNQPCQIWFDHLEKDYCLFNLKITILKN